jgi:hypothetical protein
LGFRGVDIRETGERIVFRALLQGTTGNVITSGTTNLKLYELQANGSLRSYDFNDNSFKTTALTTENQEMVHRTGNNGNTSTGIWTFSLTTLSGFVAGNIYFAAVTNTNAAPNTQVREFQFGSGSAALNPYNGTDAGLTNLATLTTTRSGYLDNLNVGGPVASKADIENLSGGAVRLRINALSQFGIPDSGTNYYTIEARTFDVTNNPVDADSDPEIHVIGITSGNLDDHLGPISHPSVGIYRWLYGVESTDVSEEIRIDISAVLDSESFSNSALVQITHFVAEVFTVTDREHLEAIFAKLPSNTYLTGTNDATGDVNIVPQVNQALIDLGIPSTLSNANTNTNTLVGRLSATRAANLDNLDATISSREAEAIASSRAIAIQNAITVTQQAIAALHDFDPTSDQVDGMTYQSALEFLLAVIGGTTVVEGNTVTFNRRNGSTAKVLISYGASQGERTGSTLLD